MDKNQALENSIDYSKDCYVDLHVGGYGALSGLFYTRSQSLDFLAGIFRGSKNYQPSFLRDGRRYIKAKFNPCVLSQFMQSEIAQEKELAESFYRNHGFYEQNHDFCEIWSDNDITEVEIHFPTM